MKEACWSPHFKGKIVIIGELLLKWWSKEFQICFSVKAMKALAKIVKIIFFKQLWKLTKGLQQSEEQLCKKKV